PCRVAAGGPDGVQSTEMRARHLVVLVSIGLFALGHATVSAAGESPARATLDPKPVPCDRSAGSCWAPSVKARWQYQLQGSPDPKGLCRYEKTGFVNIGVTGT